jgi:hypothetical protein
MFDGSRRVLGRFAGRHGFTSVRSQSAVPLIASGQSAVSKILDSRLRLRLGPETAAEEAAVSKLGFLGMTGETG